MNTTVIPRQKISWEQKRELARDYIKRGDDFYQRAEVYYRDITSTQVNRNTPLPSSKSDAIKFYQFAIDAYETALKLDPTLDQESNSLVGVQLNLSRQRLRRLTAGPPRVGFAPRQLR